MIIELPVNSRHNVRCGDAYAITFTSAYLARYEERITVKIWDAAGELLGSMRMTDRSIVTVPICKSGTIAKATLHITLRPDQLSLFEEFDT